MIVELGKFAMLAALLVAGFTATASITASNATLQTETRKDKGATVAISARLAIKSPKTNLCPAKAEFSGWIHMNRPGPVSYTLVARNGDIKGPFRIDATQNLQSVQGVMANFENTVIITEAVDTQYRVEIASENGNKIESDWVELRSRCSFNTNNQLVRLSN
jgi:hypothetical protein